MRGVQSSCLSVGELLQIPQWIHRTHSLVETKDPGVSCHTCGDLMDKCTVILLLFQMHRLLNHPKKV